MSECGSFVQTDQVVELHVNDAQRQGHRESLKSEIEGDKDRSRPHFSPLSDSTQPVNLSIVGGGGGETEESPHEICSDRYPPPVSALHIALFSVPYRLIHVA
ncbi:hypothetical protein DPEC_G00108580 [Dallia pectoralis]|uniref:Uncharacterized protein n=1 Tax=Dallia pectoralis TaxID=75939 RepID=A0ACC2GT15_DALPE|nr:hypothetical protein DPEC_G00108580 [Dallia pectoralis]